MRKLGLLKRLGKRSVNSSAPKAESSEARAVRPRSERYGLMLLAGGLDARPDDAGTEQYPVDIIAVHGLNGDAYTTWTHKNGVLWLQDLLPDLLPGCRVFTFGYPSQVVFSTSFAQVQEYARQLLSSLRDVQEHSDKRPRSIIFICHSLGGIVCKQALVFAHEDDATYGGVLKSVTGVVFLGTPHRGSSAATLGSVVGTIVNLPGLPAKSVRTDLLDYLKPGSRQLQDLAISVRNRLANLTVVSFYESEAQYPLPSVIVDQASAVLNIPREDIISLPANHRDLCRFPGETGAYKAVSAAVRRIAKASTWRISPPNRRSTHSSQRSLLSNSRAKDTQF
ncbi:Alpha/Beta hydrolase protein [Immersiella caudata]|uniref:GPI inositol-deacylase n=1 Tax=Immersiella caudata TaxID=314043 RepID=A0AA39WBZ8_9PEZI|nr:Alpha/Beta hydrolase protein [Immersiella caudata]